MEEEVVKEIRVLKELDNELSTDDISKLKVFMKVPAALCDNNCDGVSFLLAMRNWEKFNPNLFHQALTSMKRVDLLAIATKLPWLCTTKPALECDFLAEELSMKTFIRLLRTEITRKELKYFSIASRTFEGKEDFKSTITACLEEKIIAVDLKLFQQSLTGMNRQDVASMVKEYESVFSEMSEEEFISKMKRELLTQAKELLEWERKLKLFLETNNIKVQQMLGDDQLVSLESVYVELTILRQKPRYVKFEDETTFNEIAYLRKIARKEIEITPVDFTEELKSYKTEKPKIWCLIGNPGCGKTFLSKRIALRFSQCELKQISYSIAIPCRNTDWHSMECTRVEEDKAVTTEFVQEWLCLGLPVTSDWPKELAKYLAKSDGEGLLLIIDGLDEFTKKIPFEKSLLYLLLTRQTLYRSTIIVTTRPGAWTDISSQHEFQVDRFYQVLGFSPENRDMYFQKQI